MPQPPISLEQTVRTLQILTIAMVIGVLVCGAIFVFALGVLNDPPDGVLISAIAAGWSVIAFVLHLVVPPIVTRQQALTEAGEGFHGVYVARTIIGLALLEGAAFFNIFATLFEHNWWSLAIAGGLVFWMLAMFPTQTRVAHWIETQQLLSQTE